MSKWTHIAGMIRIDHIPLGIEPLEEREAEELISRGSPSGSEGGLTFNVKKTQVIRPMGFSAVWGSISFAGDLRDFHIEDFPEIIKWLEDIPRRLDRRQSMIRQGIVLIEPEYAKEKILIFDLEEEKWKEVK